MLHDHEIISLYSDKLHCLRISSGHTVSQTLNISKENRSHLLGYYYGRYLVNHSMSDIQIFNLETAQVLL